MAINTQDYWLKPGETSEQYNTRIAALRGETTTPVSTPTQGTTVSVGVNPVTGMTNQQMYDQTNDVIARAKAVLQQSYDQPNVPFTGSSYDPNKVGSGDLTGGTGTNFKSPSPTTYGATAYDQLGAAGEQAQSYTDRLLELNKSLEGESAYRQQQEQVYGIDTKTQLVNDFTSQMNTLQAEAAAIPLQLEQQAQGRGITTAMLGRQQARALRDNTIETLRVNAQLQAAQGNLTTAENLVKKAVAAKYDPIKEQINTAKSNLDLILKSPEYSNEEKQKAAQQKAIEEQKSQAIKLLEKEETNKGNLINQVLKNDANLSAQTLTNLIKQLQDESITYDQAVQIATQSGVFQDKVSGTTSTDQNIIQYYADKVSNGELDLSNVPAETRNSVADALYQKSQPRDYTDEEFRQLINTGKSQDYTYEQILQEIDSDKTIKNKDRAKLIAGELYGKSTQTTTQQNKDPFSWFSDEIFDPLTNFLFGK